MLRVRLSGSFLAVGAAIITTVLFETSSATAVTSSGLVLEPFKDELHAIRPFDGVLHRCQKYPERNPKTLSLPKMDGRHVIYEYSEREYVDKRDKRVNGRWVNSLNEDFEKLYLTPLSAGDVRNFDLPLASGKLETAEVGNPNGARFAVIFIHGAAGIYANKDLGMKDDTFSGNFNRLKNLVVRNKGVYYTPTIKDFPGQGPKDVAQLIAYISAKAVPGAPIVLACASSGGMLCAGISQMEEPSKRLSGFILMGASIGGYIGTPAHRNRVPVVYAEGTCDYGNPYHQFFGAFEAMLRKDKTYPTQFQGFADGVHGTPIRMMDWRATLNWIFSVQR